MDDNRCPNKHDSIPLSIFSWRSLVGGISTSVIDASSPTNYVGALLGSVSLKWFFQNSGQIVASARLSVYECMQ